MFPTVFKVVVGMNDLDIDSQGEIHLVECITHQQQIHPNQAYDQTKAHAILTLSQPVTVTNFVRPACLPGPFTGPGQMYVSGWGQTQPNTSLDSPQVNQDKVLRTGRLGVVPQSKCVQDIKNAIGIEINLGIMCASPEYPSQAPTGSGACIGDSGGKHQETFYFATN